MTDEQIKQNALKAEKEHGNFNYQYQGEAFNKGYLAGAHSRDEEIEELKKQLAAMTRLKNSFAGGVDILDRDNNNLQKELDKLRNPWISVEDKLPKKTRNLSPFPDEYDEKVVLVINKQGGKRLAYRDYKGVWRDDYTCKLVNQNYARITHWMPIRQYKNQSRRTEYERDSSHNPK